MTWISRHLPRAAACLAAGIIALMPAALRAETRVALVIGNGGYASAPLPNARNDAQLVAGALQSAGFAVTTALDADQRELKQAVRDFAARLKAAGPDAAAAFYYAGHGMQINGRNYLIPVNTPLRSAADVEYETVEAQWILDMIGESGAPLSIIMLDACRNNPFPSISRGARGGLARMDAPRGSILSYSTAPGDVALDGRGANSPYSSALANAIRTPGLKIEDAFKQVRRSVLAETDDRQVPWESSSLVGDFYFGGQGDGAPAPVSAPAPATAGAFRDCPDCPDMVALPGGRLSMGTDAGNEAPRTEVAIQPFALARTEITRGAFARFVADTGREPKQSCWIWALVWLPDGARNWRKPGIPQTDAHPVVCVSWSDARAYADWISAKSGKRYRLPSEAEWEYAAGGAGPLPWGRDEARACEWDNLHDAAGFRAYGNFAVARFDCDDGAGGTAPSGSYRANRLGLQDMLGNAWEWTADCWNGGHRGRPSSGAARQGGDCGNRVFKGGNYTNDKSSFRPAYRHPGLRDEGNIYAGFRLARDLN